MKKEKISNTKEITDYMLESVQSRMINALVNDINNLNLAYQGNGALLLLYLRSMEYIGSAMAIGLQNDMESKVEGIEAIQLINLMLAKLKSKEAFAAELIGKVSKVKDVTPSYIG